jgi:hypothetical protein
MLSFHSHLGSVDIIILVSTIDSVKPNSLLVRDELQVKTDEREILD